MYTWNLVELKRKKNNLELIRKTKRKKLSEDTLLKINYSIATYDFLLSFFNHDVTPQYIKDDISDKNFVDSFFSNIYKTINKDIILSTINASDTLENSGINSSYYDNTITFIDTNDVIKMTKDIFALFSDQEVMDKVNYFLDQEKHLLHISDSTKLTNFDAEYSGFSGYDIYNKEGYAIVFRNGKIRDLYTLVHELFHLIISEHKQLIYNDDTFIGEVEGAFADLVVTDYLYQNKILVAESNNIELNNYTNTRNFIRNLYIAHNFHDMFLGDNFDLKKINKTIFTDGYKYTIDDDDIKSSLLSLKRDLTYSFSFLIALDLFYKYKNGYNNVIDDLRMIGSTKRNPFIFLERCNVSFYKDGYKNLDDYQKILLRKNKR